MPSKAVDVKTLTGKMDNVVPILYELMEDLKQYYQFNRNLKDRTQYSIKWNKITVRSINNKKLS